MRLSLLKAGVTVYNGYNLQAVVYSFNRGKISVWRAVLWLLS